MSPLFSPGTLVFVQIDTVGDAAAGVEDETPARAARGVQTPPNFRLQPAAAFPLLVFPVRSVNLHRFDAGPFHVFISSCGAAINYCLLIDI